MKIIRIVTALMLAAAGAITFCFGKNAVGERGVNVSPAEYKGILTMWQVDSFEGGVGSRKRFLMSISREFERKYSGIFVTVLDYTAEAAERAMEEGKRPDLISYGTGVNVTDMRALNVAAYSAGGGYNGNVYALPWCRGGYCLIENPDFIGNKNTDGKLLVSQGEYTNPLAAYVASEKEATETEILAPYKAYAKFTAGKVKYFLGTQRDIHRLILRGMDFTSLPLDGYNDLYQYVSVTAAAEDKAYYAVKFAEYLISEKVQRRVNEIGMFSCYVAAEYESQDLSAMQKTEFKSVVSAFIGKDKREELRLAALAATTGDEKEKDNLKKLLSFLEK